MIILNCEKRILFSLKPTIEDIDQSPSYFVKKVIDNTVGCMDEKEKKYPQISQF